MKRKLLLAALCVVGALGFRAQAQSWTSGSEVAEGEYYLYNVEADRYLTNGSSWVTHSVVDGQGTVLTISSQGDGYKLYSGVSGGQGPYVWGSWMNDNNGTGYWTFTQVNVAGYTNVYTLQRSSDSQYLVWSGGGSGAWGNEVNTQADSDSKCYWMLIPKASRQTFSNATVENPLDVTYLINDPDFEKRVSNNSNSSPASGSGQTSAYWNNGGFWRQYSAQTFANAIFFEKYSGSGLTTADAINQSPTLTAGTYCLSATAYASCTQAYLYAGEDETQISTAGKYTVYFNVSSEQAVELGVKIKDGGTGTWVAFDNVRLFYYGDVSVAEVMLADYVKAYNEALAEAQAFTETSMFDAAWSDLQDAISDNTLDLNNVTQQQLEDATTNLKAANAAAIVAVKRRTVYDGAVALINGGTNVDLTSVVENAGFEDGNLNGWTSVNGGAPANNNNWSKVGTYYVERWTQNTNNTQQHLSDGTLTHDALVLPAGLYTITAKAQNQEQQNGVAGTGYFLYANDEKVEITGTNTYSTTVKLDADKSELVIKFALEGCTGNWISCDNVTLTYVGEDFPAYTLVTGKMNAAVTAAQTAAAEAFEANKTVANYNALIAAIASAQASKAAYVAAATAIANANDIKTNHNFASAEAATTFAEAIEALETKYEANTMTTDEGNGAGLALGSVVTGWHAGANSAAVAYLNNGFGLTDFDAALYINTWSTEGEGDGSNFKVPFYEYFAGEGSALGKNTWTGQVSGLENGLYRVSAWVRVRSMNGETAAADLTGISMNVNGGTSVDVTEGDIVPVQEGNARFQHKVYAAEGLVKDGVLNLNFDIAEDNNIHWLSFKNVKYTKERDLTPEEEAVVPTAIALYNGETEVTEAIALNATNNTVTLTPVYTPADATEGVEWTSSDESVATVANGVVTAVSSGTSTITVTSTLDASVSATATINVAFPETTVPEYANNGATRTIYNYGPNLIKNGSFEYPNAYYGWTYGTGSTTPITSEKFDIVTEGAADGSQYLKAKTSEGGAAAGSLNTSWAIEPGKTYVFGYKVKSTAASTGNQYIGTSLNTSKGQENANAKMANPAYKANEWTDVEYEFESGEYTYLVFNARWLANSLSFDGFYLCEVLGEPTVEGNVEYATAAIPTANIGTGAFQYSQDAIDAANNLVQGTATVADVEAAYEALTTLNAPAATQAYNLVFNCEGHSATGNALTLIPNPNQSQGLYGLKYLLPANVNLAQAFYFIHTTGNKYKVYAYDTDNKQRYITTQAEGYGTTWYEGIRTIDDADKAMEIEIRPNGEGLYLLWNTGANKPLAHNGNNNNDLFTNNTANFQFVETEMPSVTINTTALGYGTLMLPFGGLEVPLGVTAYTCEELDGTTLVLVEEEDRVLEANTPYIIEGSWNETPSWHAQGTALTYTSGLLTGVYEQQKAPVGSYVLQKQNEKVAFYPVADGENMQPNVPANRAYLTAPGNNAQLRGIFFPEDSEATAIDGLDVLTSGDFDAIYTANGVKVQTLQKGLNIVKKGNKSYKIMVK